jgi:hypothetical protein
MLVSAAASSVPWWGSGVFTLAGGHFFALLAQSFTV